MITRTYLSKFNTIISGSTLNTGINPIAELVYGSNVSRVLCYFDHSRIKEMVDKGIFPNKEKLHHTLHITNAGSLDFTQVHDTLRSSINHVIKKRATSFDIIFFKIPMLWDRGKGYDYSKTFFNEDFYDDRKNQHNPNRLMSTDGSTWYKPRNGYNWAIEKRSGTTGSCVVGDDGVYSNEFLSDEYDKFSEGEDSVIIGRQHFDIGNENICLDITKLANSYIDGTEENYGIGFAFSPQLERTKKLGTAFTAEANQENYVGFLTDKTNTFFEPYVETYYDDYINDDRANFVIDKDNKLYLYCTIGGKLTNLDVIPTCTVSATTYDEDGNESTTSTKYEVKHHSVGVYYIDIKVTHEEYEPNTMLYDTWSNIVYKGSKLEDVYLDFTLKAPSVYFNIGKSIEEEATFTPSVYGINSNEVIKRGDVRKLGVTTVQNYSTTNQSIDAVEARLYVLDGTREIDVIPWEHLNKTINESYFIIDTNMLIPNKYYIDVKINYGMQSIIHHDKVHFTIVDDLNNKFN